MAPNTHPWRAIFDQKGAKNGILRTPATLSGRTLRRPTAQNDPGCISHRFWVDLASMFGRFWLIFQRFFDIFVDFCIDFATARPRDTTANQTLARRNARKRLNPPPPFRGTGVPDPTSSPASSKASAGPAHSAGPPPKCRAERPSSLKISNFSIFGPPLLKCFVFLRAHFSIFFSHRFFFDFWIYFGSILALVLVILASFWHPFFEHRFCTDLWLIFH